LKKTRTSERPGRLKPRRRIGGGPPSHIRVVSAGRRDSARRRVAGGGPGGASHGGVTAPRSRRGTTTQYYGRDGRCRGSGRSSGGRGHILAFRSSGGRTHCGTWSYAPRPVVTSGRALQTCHGTTDVAGRQYYCYYRRGWAPVLLLLQRGWAPVLLLLQTWLGAGTTATTDVMGAAAAAAITSGRVVQTCTTATTDVAGRRVLLLLRT
jgi:hypothetical protein